MFRCVVCGRLPDPHEEPWEAVCPRCAEATRVPTSLASRMLELAWWGVVDAVSPGSSYRASRYATELLREMHAIEPFTTWCACPRCHRLACHWIETPSTRPDCAVDRVCVDCEHRWNQDQTKEETCLPG